MYVRFYGLNSKYINGTKNTLRAPGTALMRFSKKNTQVNQLLKWGGFSPERDY